MQNTIPHIIHYCWFGSSDKPRSVQKYIDNWKKMLPDYQFMEWNESNCDLENEIVYVKEAYQRKKYAFVSDYIRVKKLFEYGGIYFDTDVKVLKRFEQYMGNHSVVLGFQGAGNLLTAFIATVPHHPLFEEFLSTYQERRYIREDGTEDQISINRSLNPLVEKYGLCLSKDKLQYLQNGIVVYPTEYFCAFNVEDWHPQITNKTCTVHYMSSSWRGWRIRAKAKIYRGLYYLLGENKYELFRRVLKRRGGTK